MAQFIEPVGIETATYRGLRRIFQYTNWDGELTLWNCGQAAAATFLTHLGVFPPSEERAGDVMRQLESAYPPDIVGGWFGTSRRKVERICRDQDLVLDEIANEDLLRERLDRDQPVMVMLGVPGPKMLGFTLPAGHWMVAFGYDETDVHLTNWGKMSWSDFRERWDSLTPRLINMRNRGLVTE